VEIIKRARRNGCVVPAYIDGIDILNVADELGWRHESYRRYYFLESLTRDYT